MKENRKGELSDKETTAVNTPQAQQRFDEVLSREKSISNEEIFCKNLQQHLRERYPQYETNTDKEMFFQLVNQEWCEAMEENKKMRDEYDKIFEAIDDNPRLAVLLAEIMKGEPIRVALIKSGVYLYEPKEGDDDYERFCECKKEIKQTREQIERTRAIREQNVEKTRCNIEEFYATKRLSEEQIDDFAVYVQQMVEDMVDGTIQTDTLQRLWLGYTFEEQIEAAKKAGVIEGKNESIERSKEHRNNTDGLPINRGARISSSEKPKLGYIERIMTGQYR